MHLTAPCFLLAIAASGLPTIAQVPGDILACSQNQLRHFTASGTSIDQIAIPWATGVRPPTESARDLAVAPNGDVYVFNGTFTPYLSVLRAQSGQWQHFTDPLWSTTNTGSIGGVAIYEGGVFTAGAQTAFHDGALFRFDIATETFAVFGTQFPLGFQDLTIGWDGKLYALDTYGQDVEVFAPDTLAHERSIALPFALDGRGIGVLPDGTLLIATWQQGLKHFDGDGNLLATLVTGSRHFDLDVDACGNVLCGDWRGHVHSTNAALGGFDQFFTGVDASTYVAFATPTIPQPAIATPRAGVPPNPQLLAGLGARLGTLWTPTLTSSLPGALFTVVVYGAGPANMPSPYGTLLFDEALTWFVYDSQADSVPSVWIPANCWLNGVTFVAQGGEVSLQEIALTNALDVRIGGF